MVDLLKTYHANLLSTCREITRPAVDTTIQCCREAHKRGEGMLSNYICANYLIISAQQLQLCKRDSSQIETWLFRTAHNNNLRDENSLRILIPIATKVCLSSVSLYTKLDTLAYLRECGAKSDTINELVSIIAERAAAYSPNAFEILLSNVENFGSTRFSRAHFDDASLRQIISAIPFLMRTDGQFSQFMYSFLGFNKILEYCVKLNMRYEAREILTHKHIWGKNIPLEYIHFCRIRLSDWSN